jgi:ABC-type multidrug transport system ATPase subunit
MSRLPLEMDSKSFDRNFSGGERKRVQKACSQAS